jgi:replicative DNA helicase
MNEFKIIKALLNDRLYFHKIHSLFRKEDFDSLEIKDIYDEIVKTYYYKISIGDKNTPVEQEVELLINKNYQFNEEKLNKLMDVFKQTQSEELDQVSTDFLLLSTEDWLRKKRLSQVLMRGVDFLSNKDKSNSEYADILSEMQDVVKLSISTSLGHDYVSDVDFRFTNYTTQDDKVVSSGILPLDEAGAGKPKSLTVILATSNVGKSMWMASWATNAIRCGFNVAIFTFEDGELGYASRIDANILGRNNRYLRQHGLTLKGEWDTNIKNIKGKLKIKEFPTASANVNHIKTVLQDWYNKETFLPDIIFVDYINIMQSTRSTHNGYESGKYVAEELRALAVEYGIPVISATQGRRDVYGKSKSLGMEDVAESIGIPQTVDCMIGIVGEKELPDIQYVNILKSRSIDKNKFRQIIVNVDIELQRVTATGTNYKPPKLKKETKETISTMEQLVKASEQLTEDQQEKVYEDINQGRNSDLLTSLEI